MRTVRNAVGPLVLEFVDEKCLLLAPSLEIMHVGCFFMSTPPVMPALYLTVYGLAPFRRPAWLRLLKLLLSTVAKCCGSTL
jgi:hypothetical protein